MLVGNVAEVRLSAANRAIVIVLMFELLLLVFLKMVYKDWQKVGFIAVLLTLLMFLYGHIYSHQVKPCQMYQPAILDGRFLHLWHATAKPAIPQSNRMTN